MNRKKRFIKNTFILTLTSLLNRTIGLIFRSYLSSKIGAEGLGIYGLILETYSLAITLTAAGISIAVTRLVSESSEKNECEKKLNIKKIISTSVFISLSASIVTGLCLFFFSHKIGTYILNEPRTIIPIKILSFSLPFLSVSACLRGYFYGTRKTLSSATEQIIEQVCEITVFFLLISQLSNKNMEFACSAIVIGTTSSEIISCVYSYCLYKIDVHKYKGKSKKSFVKQLIKISLPITASSCVSSGLSTIENVLVPSGLQKHGFSKKSALCSYGIITGMVNPLISFPSGLLFAVSSLITTELSESNALGKRNDVKRVATKTIRITAIFSFIVATIFIVFGDVISLFAYQDATCGIFLKIFSPLIPLIYLETILSSILRALNDQLNLLLYSIIISCVRVALTLILLPMCGIKGELIVIFSSTILTFILVSLRVLKIFTNC